MNLVEALEQVERLDTDLLICAKRPWSDSSEACIVAPTADLRVPNAVKAAGFDYFIDVSSALEALEVFGDRKPTEEQKLELLLFYGENDAYPDWVFDDE